MGCGLSRGPANGSGDATTPARVGNVAKQGRTGVVALNQTSTSSSSARKDTEVTASEAARSSKGNTASLSRLKRVSSTVSTSASVRSSETTASSSKSAQLRIHRKGPSKDPVATISTGSKKTSLDTNTNTSSDSATLTKRTAALAASKSSNGTTTSLKSSNNSKRETTLMTATPAAPTSESNAKSSSRLNSSGASSRTKTTTEDVKTMKQSLTRKTSTSSQEKAGTTLLFATSDSLSRRHTVDSLSQSSTSSSSKISGTLSRLTKITQSFASKITAPSKRQSSASIRTEKSTAQSMKSSRPSNAVKSSESRAGSVSTSTAKGTSLNLTKTSIAQQSAVNNMSSTSASSKPASSKSSRTSSRATMASEKSTKSHNMMNISTASTRSKTSQTCLSRTAIYDGAASEASDDETTLVPTVRLRNVRSKTSKAAATSSYSAIPKRTLKNAQTARTSNSEAADSASGEGPKEPETESVVVSVNDNTLPPTCTASLSEEHSVTQSVASTPVVHRGNSVRFVNCYETCDSTDTADDREDFFFLPASWCTSGRASANGVHASSSVILNVRRAKHTTLSADEAYHRYWLSSCHLAAPSESESSISDDDEHSGGDATQNAKNAEPHTATSKARVVCDEAAQQSHNNPAIGDAPYSVTTNSCSDSCSASAQLDDNRNALDTSIAEPFSVHSSEIVQLDNNLKTFGTLLTESVDSQLHQSIVSSSNINNSAVVRSAPSEYWDQSVSSICASRASPSFSNSGMLPTTSSLVLDSPTIKDGKLQLHERFDVERVPDQWKLNCQQVIDDYNICKVTPTKLIHNSNVDSCGAPSNDGCSVQGSGEGTHRNNKDEKQTAQITTTAIGEVMTVKQPTVVRSRSFCEQVDKLETLTFNFEDKNENEDVPKLFKVIEQQQAESPRLPSKLLPQSNHSGVIAWQQPIAQLTGSTTTGNTASKGTYYSGVTRPFFHEDDIWTEDINDIEADIGCALRTTASQLTSAYTSKPSPSQPSHFFDQTTTETAQLQSAAKLEQEFEKTENIYSVDDEEISKSMSQQHLDVILVRKPTTSTACVTSVHTATPTQLSSSPDDYFPPQEAGSLRSSTPLLNQKSIRLELECGTTKCSLSQASTAIVSSPRLSPSCDEHPSSERSLKWRGLQSPTPRLQVQRTPPRTSPALQTLISELGELQAELRTRIAAAEAAHSSSNATASSLTATEAAHLEEAMTSANSLAEKLCSLVRQRRLKVIETGAECTRHGVHVTTTTTTECG